MNPDIAICETSENEELKTEDTMVKIGNYPAEINNDTIKSFVGTANSNLSPGRRNLSRWLGKTFRVVITDGRVLVGFFNCTDKDANLVLSMCAEYLEEGKDARILGNVMVPGKHIVSISVDEPSNEHLVTET